jgi:predicted hydrocarbon binding protein
MDLTGFTLPNKIVAVLLFALDELMGTNGLNALLNAAGLKDWIDSPPENNDERGIDFHHLSVLTQTLVDLYGEKGSQSLMRPANNRVFQELWAADSRFESLDEPEYAPLEAIKRIEQGMDVFSSILVDQSDLVISSGPSKAGVHFTLEKCPYCWGIEGETPQCATFIGLLESAVRKFAPETAFTIEETECASSGSDHCVFIISVQE